MKKIRVGIVEDNRRFRESLESVIQQQDSLLLACSLPHANGIEAVLQTITCDVLLLDIRLPGLNGLEALHLLKKRFPELKVVMQTVVEDDDAIVQAICHGASGYLLKIATAEEYISAIHDVYGGGVTLTPGIAAKVLRLFNSVHQKTTSGGFGLTDRETQVLAHLVDGRSYKMIADRCDITYDTVRFHMKNIYAKLQVESMTAAVGMALKHGLI